MAARAAPSSSNAMTTSNTSIAPPDQRVSVNRIKRCAIERQGHGVSALLLRVDFRGPVRRHNRFLREAPNEQAAIQHHYIARRLRRRTEPERERTARCWG